MDHYSMGEEWDPSFEDSLRHGEVMESPTPWRPARITPWRNQSTRISSTNESIHHEGEGGGGQWTAAGGAALPRGKGRRGRVDPRVDWGQSDRYPNAPLLFRAAPLRPVG